ncbi:glycosyltransferase family 4 protein [Aeromonas allosaccharophila]|uniref:glycosyltransferase family 4 protein n=1 Tax=Aeromonas allosaccharophila TaxID=656 RepID=UPI003D1A4F73
MTKKIMFVANTAWSMFNFRRGVICQLIHNGYQITIIAPPDAFSEKLQDLGCKVIDLSVDAKGTNPFQDLCLVHTLYNHYRIIKPDFIIHYTIKPNVYGSIAAKLAGIPSLAVTTGLGYTFVNNNLVAKVARILYKIAFRFPDEVWFLNEDDRQEFLHHRLVANYKAKLLHGEGVNLEHYSPQSIELAESVNDGIRPIRFLLIGRMLWDKGIGEYVAAARIIKKRDPQIEFQLLGACDVANPSVITHEQISLWEQEGLVKYLGTTDDVRPFIVNADCIVLPSYREGIPRTMIEAASMAKPLITTDVPGCRDVVLPGVTGWLCPAKDAPALASCFEQFLNMDIASRREFGIAGRKFMAIKFNEEIVIERYLKVLKKYE